MPKILAISSQVACGHVGLSAIVPAVQALQQQVIALPTVLLSNHPGHPHVAGNRVDPLLLKGMLEAIAKNGWLTELGTVLTGYCPTIEHVEFAKNAIMAAKQHQPKVTVICDPIIGDDEEGVYIDLAAAEAIKQELLPLADILMPNHFELGWLTGKTLSSFADVKAAARALSAKQTIVTSVPWSKNRLANLQVSADQALAVASTMRCGVPKGTGDFLSGVFAHDRDLGLATARTEALIDASLNEDHLKIAEAAPLWLRATANDTFAV